MIGRHCALLLKILLFAGGLGVSLPAAAQCRLCAAPTTAPPSAEDQAKPLRLQVVTTLDFDRLIVMGDGAGTAVVNPDGTSQALGVIGPLSGRAIAGEIVIRGEPGRAVRVDLPRSIELYGLKGGAVRIDSLTSDLATLPELNAAGELRIRIGGELRVSGDVDGDFRGDVPIIVDYL